MSLLQFQTVGRDLFTSGLVCGTSGNLSIRMGDRMLISRRNSGLANLQEQDLIETGIYKNDRFTPMASSELPVHRAIYKITSAGAIVHAHPSYAVALSLTENEIIPSDEEGNASIGCVPIIGPYTQGIVPGELSNEIGQALQTGRIVMVRGHGSFATGQILEEAYDITAAFEESCKILCLLKSLQVKHVRE
jgi:L-fuculose-phosphate aldolase